MALPGSLPSLRSFYEDRLFLRQMVNGFRSLFEKKSTMLPTVFLLFLLVLGIGGQSLAPYDHTERLYDDDNQLLRADPPSLAHPLGTTDSGQDVLSRVIVGARPTVLTGVLGGIMIIGIGMSIGVTAGYVGGRTDDVLMRFTDVAYSLPLIPFALVMIAFLGIGFFSTIAILGLILWRGNARVLRSQVLQVRERPYIQVMKASGASTRRIIVKHIFPNVAPMAVLFFSLGMGYAIVAQASLAFIGATDPFVPSWGIMIRNAYESGRLGTQLGWSIVPGLLLGLTVASAFMLGREFETDDSRGSIARGGG